MGAPPNPPLVVSYRRVRYEKTVLADEVIERGDSDGDIWKWKIRGYKVRENDVDKEVPRKKLGAVR